MVWGNNLSPQNIATGPNELGFGPDHEFDVSQGLSGLIKDLQAQSKLKFGEWLTDWMENHKRIELRPAIWENYQGSIKKHIVPE